MSKCNMEFYSCNLKFKIGNINLLSRTAIYQFQYIYALYNTYTH